MKGEWCVSNQHDHKNSQLGDVEITKKRGNHIMEDKQGTTCIKGATLQ